MNVYLDVSVLVALFTQDALTNRAEDFLRRHEPVVVVSDFAAAEFASAVARRVRLRELSRTEAKTAFSTLDSWTARVAAMAQVDPADTATAASFLRRLDLPLRTPDALHIAMVQRLGLVLATFDRQMETCARTLDIDLAWRNRAAPVRR